MKKTVLFLSLMLLCIVSGFSQASFNTGVMEVYTNQYGRIRLYSSDGLRQLERASILVATSPTTVFDYTNDAEQLEATVLVENPEMSDFEIYGAYDNSYSSLPPDVIVKQSAYGWNNAAFTIIKFNVKNDESSAINATIGVEFIPYLNEEYGFDSLTYLSDEGVVRFHRGPQINLGAKLLSASLSSLYSFEWYEDYSVDTDYWNWMNYGSLQPLYASNTADGPVAVTAQNPVTINPGQSFDVYYALALGENQQAMLSNIAAAVEKYDAWFTTVDEPGASEFNLLQNYPNPFGQTTMIRYQLPANGWVSLQVYDIMGNLVSALVDEEQAAGTHIVDFDAAGLPGGVYHYTLRYNGQMRTNTMMVAK
ncbi:MAG TPA: T9SS type A sorting domain-containing protein [Bacteroidales bacterium]|nr:T9SS type A sorting domain-containing protein [Bacteroidales bacterium]HNS47236.1 T9SS type A sorting domain-containing protein [Bacteroidales bacterium]